MRHDHDDDRARWRRLLGLSTAGLAFVAALAVTASGVAWPSRPTVAAAGATAQSTAEDRVATFAARAVAQAGLIDPGGRYYDYVAVFGRSPEWQVDFDVFACFRTVQLETCNREGAGALTVGEVAGRLKVLEARGPMTSEQRASLLAYSEPAGEEELGVEFLVVQVREPLPGARGGIKEIRAAYVWTGPLTPTAEVSCVLEVFDANGEVTHTQDVGPVLGPPSEAQRSGSIYGAAIPGDVEADSATITC